MARRWIQEHIAIWNSDKARIVGRAPDGVFDKRYAQMREGELIAGDWWRVEEDGRTVGYGWLDVNWGDAEMLLATAAEAQNRGVGTFIVQRLEREAKARGLNYLYNVVRPHPDAARVTAWLRKRGFFMSSSDGRLLRAVVRPDLVAAY